MKIIAIGRNYADHIKELNNEHPDEPVIFLKPDTALLKNNDPFYFPKFSENIHHELELIVRISREGKYISEQHAHKYYDKVGLGIDFTARDLQQKAKEKGLPWDKAKGFNGSAPISNWKEKSEFSNLQDLNFNLKINGEEKQVGQTANMIHSIDAIISHVSEFFTLKTGDIIFTGTPKGVGPVKIGDHLEAYLEQEKLLDFEVK